jgi:UTP-glucose-1-phosphate uridylyltransferase
MTLLIMAAGVGNRYGGLKQFENLGPNSEYLFEFNIFDAIENGFTHIVVVTNDAFVNGLKVYLLDKLPKEIKIDIIAQNLSDLPFELSKVGQRVKPWGTAHAVWAARNHIDENFVVINADDFYGNEAFRIASDFMMKNRDDNLFGIVTYSLNETLSNYGPVSRGICKVKKNFLQSICEYTEIERKDPVIIDNATKKKFNGLEPVSMNFWICNPIIFNEIELLLNKFVKDDSYNEKDEIYIPYVIQKMMEGQIIKVEINHSSSTWFGLTYANDNAKVKLRLNEMSINGLYPLPLWKT